MPPNAKSIADSNINAKANASIANNTYFPTFEEHTTDVNEDELHEVAKTFWWREFGNGNANNGQVTGTNGGSYKDFSMLTGTTATAAAFVLDDGITSISGYDVELNGNGLGDNLGLKTSGSRIWYTFIGTGITISDHNDSPRTFGQNLPYGTHVVKHHNAGSKVDSFIDG